MYLDPNNHYGVNPEAYRQATGDGTYARMSPEGPRCPNHGCVLQKTDTRGLGICPVSDARFCYVDNEEEKEQPNEKKLVLDVSGKIVEKEVQSNQTITTT